MHSILMNYGYLEDISLVLGNNKRKGKLSGLFFIGMPTGDYKYSCRDITQHKQLKTSAGASKKDHILPHSLRHCPREELIEPTKDSQLCCQF